MTPYPLPPARLVPTIEFLSRNVPPMLAMFPPRPAPALPAAPGNAPLPAAPLVPPIALPLAKVQLVTPTRPELNNPPPIPLPPLPPLPAVISAFPPLPPLPAVSAFAEKVQLMVGLGPAFQISEPR